jgi:hypothetical protein
MVIYQSAIVSIASDLKFLKEISDFVCDGMEFEYHEDDFYDSMDVNVDFDFSYLALFLEVYSKHISTSTFSPHDNTKE